MPVRAAGFSLIELLVVLVLLALASTAVVLNLPAPDPLREPAQRLAARLQHAQSLAVTGNRPLRLQLDNQGYVFQQREQGQWLPIEQPALAAQAWPATTTLSFNGQPADVLTLAIDASGGGHSGTLDLHNGPHHWQLQLHDNGRIDAQPH